MAPRPRITVELERAIGPGLRRWAAELDYEDTPTVLAVLAGAAGQLVLRRGPLAVAGDLRDLAARIEQTGKRGAN